MLSPDSRLLLLDALRPPAGFLFDRAIATTFTLDLETALMVPLALSGYAIKESPDPVEVLDAIRSCAGKIDIFCQAGGIRADRWPSDLIGLLENSIHQVPRPKPGCLFHPKVWVLRYLAQGDRERSYRCLVLSRNLTQDRSWDLVIRLDSDSISGGRGINPSNQNLNRFVLALPELAVMNEDSERASAMAELAEELRKVWWELPEDVKEIQFWPFGLPRMRKPKTEEMFTGYRHLVVSPFISPQGMAIVLGESNDTVVSIISRGDELDRQPQDQMPEGTYYQISPLANLKGDEERSEVSIQTEQMLGDLHAKLFVVETNRRARVYVGSANATETAFNGNVEFLCEISGGATRIGVDALLGEGSPLREILEEYSFPEAPAQDPKKNLAHSVEAYLFDLAGMRFRADARGTADAWSVHVTSDDPVPMPAKFDAELFISPLNRTDRKRLAFGQYVAAEFAPMAGADITPFMALTCVGRGEGGEVEKQMVVRAELVGGPSERLDEILVRQIDTPEKFLRLLDLLLGLGGALVPVSMTGAHATDGSWGNAGVGPGLLELVARSLAERPEALDALDSVVDRLSSTERGRAILPPGWNLLWEAMQGARILVGREHG
ncbi:MAG: hypothetical protein CVV27_04435 [Candidatus Melainabacteria bacterium HGW-Melainabacteria-1]|nr:MAG: hypothetical protein CVV27_04435 [Candidatus Melainabacteria bacterium HGW-Melainabacteria-1]PKO70923.1 MAG: hypothetical protein CVU20_09320 [Betaproteobacteria bacterium HGW-Betaproteobacteria-14]